MGRKCIIKLILVMMELVIPILVQVHANDLSPSVFGPSSFPIPLPDFSKIDNVLAQPEEVLKNDIESCTQKRSLSEMMFEVCIWDSFVAYLHRIVQGLAYPNKENFARRPILT